MFAFYTSLSKRTKYSKLYVFLSDLESDTQWRRNHRNLIEAFVYSEFDMHRVENQIKRAKEKYKHTGTQEHRK